jgi:polyhydroxyalkanoate synthesis regulator phasin
MLGVFATPEVSQADFMEACADAARDARNADLAKATGTLDRQIAALQEKLARAERDYQQNQTQLDDRKREELMSDAETVFSLLGGKRTRRISSTISKHRMTEKTKAQVTDAEDTIAEFKRQLAQLQQARQHAMDEAVNKWGNAVNNITEIPILPKKTDIYVSLFGVAWLPYYLAKAGDQTVEIPAFA